MVLSVKEGCPNGYCLFCSLSQPSQQGMGLLQCVPADSWISTASRVPEKNVESVSAPRCTAMELAASTALLGLSVLPGIQT